MNKREAARKRGQGLVEFAVALPVLIMLLIGVVEIGFALRSYLIVVNATREGARFASRGQFELAEAGTRIILAGGVVSQNVPFLQTGGDRPNTGMIISRMRIDEFGAYDALSTTYYISGYVPLVLEGTSEMVHITKDHTWVSPTVLLAEHASHTISINATREDANFAPLGENIVVVEVWYSYHPLWNIPLLPLPDPWIMYSKAVMREAW
jgi:hypothetical protein